MADQWNWEEEFIRLWETRPHSCVRHTSADWDKRAERWEQGLRTDGARQRRSEQRIAETVAYLRQEGLLQGGDSVADIGCGPGRFAVAFAKHAGHVTGIDLSPRMVQYGEAYAQEQGVNNVTFTACDFKQADLDQQGWRRKFDLVFSSITPAVSGREGFEKVEQMSRGFCFNSSFVHARDRVGEAALAYALPGVTWPNAWDGRSFYAMFNLLWLRGRFPQVRYYREEEEELLPVDHQLVERVTERCPEQYITSKVLSQIEEYLCRHANEDGYISFPVERWYGWILWDVRDQAKHNYTL